jgi:hypothetical protein
MKRSEAISNLLRMRTHADLSALYNSSMEVQINVASDGAERIEGDYKGRQWHGWTNGIETWKPFRIPHNSRISPEDNDFEINFNLAAHAEGIGMTGWNWRLKQSLWVGFDFDAIIGHSESHDKKLTEAELKKISELVANIPWVTVRTSTGGRGIHLYVFLNPPVPTNNHCEHAAVARSILGLIASLTGYDFHSKVDQCGGNMWVWHRKMQANPNGLKLIKLGIPLDEVPINWKDHIDVVTNRKKRIVPAFISQESTDDIERLFEELVSQKTKIPLDDTHQKLISFLHEHKLHSWWDSDLNMLVTHTKHLEKAHSELGLKGIYSTNSPGTELEEQNCFCFPMRKGAWVVRRYTPGIAESSTWTQDPNGFTKCYFNREPDLITAAKSLGGIEHEKSGFVFREAGVASQVARHLGVAFDLPNWILGRETKIKEQKDGRLLIKIEHKPNDPADKMEGWHPEKGFWTQIFSYRKQSLKEPEIGNYDNIVRHLITETDDDYGWLLRSDNQWRSEPLIHIRTFLKSLSLSPVEVDMILGSCVAKPWRLVCRPFEPEILGDRDWNRKSPQLAFIPNNSDILNYPTWLKILEHLGQGLNDAITNNEWAKLNGIFTGAHYLKCWIASMIKEPRQPLPYLFFYGEENSGKSVFHESLQLLITKGVVRADSALISGSGFNGELENCVLAVVEETDLSKTKGVPALARIKDWTTSPYLPIHRKGMTPYSIPNTTHWCQFANTAESCPVLPGDTRITMIYVDPIDPKELIPKKQLMELLIKEAPDFIASILSIELPESGDRLNLPVIVTEAKQRAQDSNKTDLDLFLEECYYYFPGNKVKLADMYDKYLGWLEPSEVSNALGRNKFSRAIATRYPKGYSKTDHQIYFGNISHIKPIEEELKYKKLILIDGNLEIEK